MSSIDTLPTEPRPHNQVSSQDAVQKIGHLKGGYVTVIDAAYDGSKTYIHGFKGTLKVNPAHLATTFWGKLLAREEERGEEALWRRKMEIEIMYMRAQGKNGREGGVYPPSVRQNKWK